MEYLKRTFAYMFRALGVLSLVCLPAALVLGIFTKPMASLSYLVDYSATYVRSFKSIFWLIFNRYATRTVYPLALILLSLVFCTSLAMAVIEKHFRVGKLMLKAPLKQINNYFLPVLYTFVLLALILFLYGMVQCGALTLLHMLVSGRGYPSVLNLVLAAVLSLGLFVLSLWLSCSAMYWTPMMVIYGFSFRDATASSLRLIDRKSGSILLGLLTPYLIVAVLESVFSLFHIAWLRVVLAVLLYLFLMLYLIVYIMVSMFDLSGMERRDAKSVIGGKRGGF
ncbi:MAG: hypothetical protein K2L51_03940 [Clostridiales bacterium]|nr:hypothetical protein [Clostridiales bacterium]